MPAHEAERAIFKHVLALGREAFSLFLHLNGTGDLGPEVSLPGGATASRLDTPHARPYRSAFGDFPIERFWSATRAG